MIRPGSSGINDEWRSKLSDEARRLLHEGLAGRDVVYRLHGSASVLVYVGVTCNPAGRLRGHVERSAWWPEVERIEIEVFPDRASAEAAEVVAIWTEHPRRNRQRYTWQASCLDAYPELAALRRAHQVTYSGPHPSANCQRTGAHS